MINNLIFGWVCKQAGHSQPITNGTEPLTIRSELSLPRSSAYDRTVSKVYNGGLPSRERYYLYRLPCAHDVTSLGGSGKLIQWVAGYVFPLFQNPSFEKQAENTL